MRRQGRATITIVVQLLSTTFAPPATLDAIGSHPRGVFSTSCLNLALSWQRPERKANLGNSQSSKWADMLQPPAAGEDISPSWQGDCSHALPPLITAVEATQLWTNV